MFSARVFFFKPLPSIGDEHYRYELQIYSTGQFIGSNPKVIVKHR